MARLEDRFVSTKAHCVEKSMHYFVIAIQSGKIQGKAWLENVVESLSKVFPGDVSQSVLTFLYSVKIPDCRSFSKFVRNFFMDNADGILSKAIEQIGNKKYTKALPLLHEM